MISPRQAIFSTSPMCTKKQEYRQPLHTKTKLQRNIRQDSSTSSGSEKDCKKNLPEPEKALEPTSKDGSSYFLDVKIHSRSQSPEIHVYFDGIDDEYSEHEESLISRSVHDPEITMCDLTEQHNAIDALADTVDTLTESLNTTETQFQKKNSDLSQIIARQERENLNLKKLLKIKDSKVKQRKDDSCYWCKQNSDLEKKLEDTKIKHKEKFQKQQEEFLQNLKNKNIEFERKLNEKNKKIKSLESISSTVAIQETDLELQNTNQDELHPDQSKNTTNMGQIFIFLIFISFLIWFWYYGTGRVNYPFLKITIK